MTQPIKTIQSLHCLSLARVRAGYLRTSQAKKAFERNAGKSLISKLCIPKQLEVGWCGDFNHCFPREMFQMEREAARRGERKNYHQLRIQWATGGLFI